jgi:hypothetical protein
MPAALHSFPSFQVSTDTYHISWKIAKSRQANDFNPLRLRPHEAAKSSNNIQPPNILQIYPMRAEGQVYIQILLLQVT